MKERISRDELYVGVIELLAKRSSCEKTQVGAILVKDNRIISMGYNGAPSGVQHCTQGGCIIENGHCIGTIHAEANVIAWAARNGISTEGTVLYTTHQPCLDCSKLLINAGIKEVYFIEPYTDLRGYELLKAVEIYSFVLGR